ncbi:S8 family peptidase [Kribbella sp. NPDC050470]|uniref:S8 family peptidase n=1 Tax=unclassified Kribbella TaxID=2644121 RepID=UPI0037BBB9BD
MASNDATGTGDEPAATEDLTKTRQGVQRARLRDKFDRDAEQPRKVDEGRSRRTEEGADFLYEKGAVLVREEYFDKVRVILERLFLFPIDDDRRPQPIISGVRLIRLRTDINPQLDTIQVLNLIRDGGAVPINRPQQEGSPEQTEGSADDEDRPIVTITGLGAGAANLNHLVHITGNGGGCPASEPEPMPAGSAPYPSLSSDRCAGEGVKVVVVDTGLDESARERSRWLQGVEGDDDLGANGTTIDTYAGHGTFIAGIIRSIAPLAEVYVKRVFGFGDGVLESDLVQALDDVLEEHHPDIISMSAGTYTYDATGLLTFPVFHERRLSHHKGVVMVVAAGNDSDRKPFWPAAAPYTVSVGALGTYWRGRADFSNFGGWVDVYAPGQDLVNAFPVGTYTYTEPPHDATGRVEQFYGIAKWSGTSFSTPVVSGLIAARMSRTGENGQDAAAALIAEAQAAAQHGVGAVLLPE